MKTDKELKALITLLDDPDPDVSKEVWKNLKDQGEKIVPELERAWESSFDETFQKRIENIIDDIQFTTTKKGLRKWYKNGSQDLIEGAYWIANFQYPELKFSEISQVIEDIANEAGHLIRQDLTPLETVRALNHVFFRIYKFTGNRSSFYTPQNFYINNVLDRKKGNPLSLAIIYISIAHRFNAPVYGINLPVNFLLGYMNPEKNFQDYEPEDIQFFLNPFNKGVVLSNEDVNEFLKEQKISPADSDYLPATNNDIIKRLITNLMHAYEKLGYSNKIKLLDDLNAIIK